MNIYSWLISFEYFLGDSAGSGGETTSQATSPSCCQPLQETLVCFSEETDTPTQETLVCQSKDPALQGSLVCHSGSKASSTQEGLICQSEFTGLAKQDLVCQSEDLPQNVQERLPSEHIVIETPKTQNSSSGLPLQGGLTQDSGNGNQVGECQGGSSLQEIGDENIKDKSTLCNEKNGNSEDIEKSQNSVANVHSSCHLDSGSQDVWVDKADGSLHQGETSNPNDREILQSRSLRADNSDENNSNPVSEGTITSASDNQNTPSLSDGLQRSDSNSSSPGRIGPTHSRLEPVISLHYSTEGTTSSTIHLGFAAFENLEAGVLQRSAEDASLNPLVSGPAHEAVGHASKSCDRAGQVASGSDTSSHISSNNELSKRKADGRLSTVSEEGHGGKCSNCGEHLDTEVQEKQSSVSSEYDEMTSTAERVPLCPSTSASHPSAGPENDQEVVGSREDNPHTELWGECSGIESSEGMATSTSEKQTREPHPHQSGEFFSFGIIRLQSQANNFKNLNKCNLLPLGLFK